MAETCTFKTPEELGLSQKQFNALIKVSGMLERGELTHMPYEEIARAEHDYYDVPESVRRRDSEFIRFNMCVWRDAILLEKHCGTACCLGGSAELVANDAQLFTHGVPEALEKLFHPNNQDVGEWDHLTPQVAAKALCHYLKTGDDGIRCWKIALGREKA